MNIIAEMWLYSLLAPHKQVKGHGEDFIKEYLKDNVSKNGDFIPMNTEHDFGYFWIMHTRIVMCIRGTHGPGAWGSNLLKFKVNEEGFHTGFCEGAKEFWPMVEEIINLNYEKVLVSSAQSRGCPIDQILSLWLMERKRKWSKPMLFNPPTPWDEKGAKRFHNQKLQALNIISPNDIVDNVGAGIFDGVHSGDMVWLPHTPEKGVEGLKDMIPGWGHSYSETTDGLIKYFENRGMETEKNYLESIRHLATI